MKQNKLSIEEQINHLKSKNIKFTLINEHEARNYLTNNTYYFKIKSYAKSFEYNQYKQQYTNLDFAYLIELSKLDMYLREYIIKLSLDTEHFLKVKLVHDLTNNDMENGYNIVNLLFKKYPYIEKNVLLKKYDSACADLIHKYENDWAVWNLIEVLSFGDFIKLFELYYEEYPEKKDKTIINLLWPLKFIRNASAHNNCLLNTLRNPYIHTHLYNNKNNMIEPSKELISLLTKIPSINKNSRKKKLRNPIIHDFVAMLFLFDKVCTSPILKEKQFSTLSHLIKARFVKNESYFKNDNLLISTYEFINKIVDYLYNSCI